MAELKQKIFFGNTFQNLYYAFIPRNTEDEKSRISFRSSGSCRESATTGINDLWRSKKLLVREQLMRTGYICIGCKRTYAKNDLNAIKSLEIVMNIMLKGINKGYARKCFVEIRRCKYYNIHSDSFIIMFLPLKSVFMTPKISLLMGIFRMFHFGKSDLKTFNFLNSQMKKINTNKQAIDFIAKYMKHASVFSYENRVTSQLIYNLKYLSNVTNCHGNFGRGYLSGTRGWYYFSRNKHLYKMEVKKNG